MDVAIRDRLGLLIRNEQKGRNRWIKLTSSTRRWPCKQPKREVGMGYGRNANSLEHNLKNSLQGGFYFYIITKQIMKLRTMPFKNDAL